MATNKAMLAALRKVRTEVIQLRETKDEGWGISLGIIEAAIREAEEE